MIGCSMLNDHAVKAANKTANGLAIEKLVVEEGLTYLEATTQFVEENSIEYGHFQKYIPVSIIDKITQECIVNRTLRKGVIDEPTNTLDI